MRAVKGWLIRAICHPCIARLIHRWYGDHIPSRGFVIDPGGDHVSWHAVPRLFWGLYEKAEINFVRQYLRTDLDVVEVGASLGVVSLHIAQRQHPSKRLVCVEANPNMIPVIRRNMTNNAKKERFDVLNLAVSSGEDETVLFEIASDPLESRIADVRLASTGNGTKVQNGLASKPSQAVPAKSLSAILREQAIDEYALVCDIEGAEVAIVRDDPGSLKKCQQIVIEMHPQSYAAWNCDLAWLNRRLGELGFTRQAARGPVAYWSRTSTLSAQATQ